MDPETNSQVWILRNSYGDKWGMGGDMYVRMGHDDFGVESEIGAYKVNLESIWKISLEWTKGNPSKFLLLYLSIF